MPDEIEIPNQIKIYVNDLEIETLLKYLGNLSSQQIAAATKTITTFFDSELNSSRLSSKGQIIIKDDFSKYNQAIRLLRYFFDLKMSIGISEGVIRSLMTKKTIQDQQIMAWYMVASDAHLITTNLPRFQPILNEALKLPIVSQLLQADAQYQQKFLQDHLKLRHGHLNSIILGFLPAVIIKIVEEYDFVADNLEFNISSETLLMTEDKLAKIRERIDSIDQNIYNLIKERAQLAIEVARLKQLTHLNPAYYRPEREAQVLRKIMEHNDSQLSDRALAQIFRDIMTACLSLQKQLTIAYLGPAGTFSQMAAETHFGKAAHTLAVETIPRIFSEVEADNAHYGVVPIENTTEGTVNLTLDSFLNSTVYICGEIELPIHQCLLSNTTDLQDIHKVYGHQQSLAQCRNWLAEHLPHAVTNEVNSNGIAAQLASQEPHTAALGPNIAAELYGVSIIKHHVEDHSLNNTRFVIIGKQQTPPSGKDKTSLLISTPHSPGSLYILLQPFANNNINLTLIESRPYRHRNWSYLFFMDIEGHQQDDNVKRALTELSQMSIMMTILGSYPRAVL